VLPKRREGRQGRALCLTAPAIEKRKARHRGSARHSPASSLSPLNLRLTGDSSPYLARLHSFDPIISATPLHPVPRATVADPDRAVIVPGGTVGGIRPAVTVPSGSATVNGRTVNVPHATVASPGRTVNVPHAAVTVPGRSVAVPHATVTSPVGPLASPVEPLGSSVGPLACPGELVTAPIAGRVDCRTCYPAESKSRRVPSRGKHGAILRPSFSCQASQTLGIACDLPPSGRRDCR